MRKDDLKFNINLSHKASPLAIREEFGLRLELLCLFNLLLEVPVAIIAHTPKAHHYSHGGISVLPTPSLYRKWASKFWLNLTESSGDPTVFPLSKEQRAWVKPSSLLAL